MNHNNSFPTFLWVGSANKRDALAFYAIICAQIYADRQYSDKIRLKTVLACTTNKVLS